MPQVLVSVMLDCLVTSSLCAPAPIWPGLALAGTGAVAFDVATGLTLAGLGAANIPTSLLIFKALALKKAAILGTLAASRSRTPRYGQRRQG